ncbi:hypothetical protein BH11MYX3_BH11MYX3_43310 [soil metagenome]
MRSLLLLTATAAATTWIAAATASSWLPGSQAHAQPSITHTQQVQSVSLDGGRGIPLAALRDVLAIHRGDQLDANRLVQDRSALEAELAARGYLSARVEPAVVTFAPGGGAYVTFQISAGPVFKLRDVSVRGASSKEASVVTLISGDDAVGSRIERARQTLANNLAARGKAATVTVALHTDEAAAAVDVELISR